MSEPPLTHKIVSLNDGVNILLVNANSHSHDHMLWSLYNFAMNFQKIRPLKGLEAEIVIVPVSSIIKSTLQSFFVFADDLIYIMSYQRCILA